MAEAVQSNPSRSDDPRAARLAIIAAARILHARDGVASVSILNVAREAGLTADAVSAHFQTPQEILMALTADDLNVLARSMQSETKAKAASSAKAETPQAGPLRKKAVMPPPLEQVMKDVAPDHGKEFISGAVARLERRIQVMEKAFSDIVDRHEKSLRDRNGAIVSVEESISTILSRMDSADRYNTELMSELRAAFGRISERLDVLERPEPEAPANVAPMSVAPMAVEMKPADPQVASVPVPTTVSEAPMPVLQMTAEAELPPEPKAVEKTEEKIDFAAMASFDKLIPGPQVKLADLGDAKPDRKDTYLSSARRAALAAAETAHTTSASINQKRSTKGSRTKFLMFACLAPVAILGTAFMVLNRNAVTAGPVQTESLAAVTAEVADQPPQDAAPAAGPQAPVSQTTPAPQQQVTAAPVQATSMPEVQVTPPAEPIASQVRIAASLQSLTQAAQAGDSHAMRDAALKYLSGDGVEVNEVEAARWLIRASYKGEPVAEYWLATLYARGHGVPADAYQANHWYEASAKQGNRRAMHSLAVASFQGWGMDKNVEVAARWFKSAADLGLVDSQFNLAVLYERGTGVPKSQADAYKWYAIAAAQGDKEADARVAVLAKQLKPEELQQAQAAVAAFKPQPMNETANLNTGSSQAPGG